MTRSRWSRWLHRVQDRRCRRRSRRGHGDGSFHVVRLAGDALGGAGAVQLAIHGHCGFRDDLLYKSRRTLHTGADLLTDKQSDRLRALFVDDAHVEVEADLGCLPAHDRRRLSPRGPRATAASLEKLITDLSAPASPRCSPSSPPWAGPRRSELLTCSPTSNDPAPATGRPRRSTDGSNTCAAPHSGSAT